MIHLVFHKNPRPDNQAAIIAIICFLIEILSCLVPYIHFTSRATAYDHRPADFRSPRERMYLIGNAQLSEHHEYKKATSIEVALVLQSYKFKGSDTLATPL